MAKEKRHRRRESPVRESRVEIKQEKVSPVRPQKLHGSGSRGTSSPPPRRRTSRSPVRTKDQSLGRRDASPSRRSSRSPRNQRSRSPRHEPNDKVKREREHHRTSDNECRRRKDQPERLSRREQDRLRDRDRSRERQQEQNTLAIQQQQDERRQHDERRRENRQRLEENQEPNFGEPQRGSNSSDAPPAEKEKPNFELSGALTEDTNTFRGVVIKYNEPPEARIPKRRWRLYPFKNDEPLPVMYVHRQSAYLLGRQRRIADIPIDHPSCSKQHAVFQYRLVGITRPDGTTGRRVKPYIIDLGSGNGTFLNNQRIESQRYYELKEKDVLKFGFSSREYVLLHEFSDTSEVDGKEEEEDEGVAE